MQLSVKNSHNISWRPFHIYFPAFKFQFIAIYGRRRVGKTFLVREVYGKQLFFSHTGVANQRTAVQLNAFADSLNSYGMKHATPANWIDAFGILKGMALNLYSSLVVWTF